jgi:transposase
MFTPTMHLTLPAAERQQLAQLLRQTTLSQAIARRTRVILGLADGQSYAAIGARLGVTDRFIALWKRRYLEGGVLALADAPRAGRGHGLSAALEAKILHLTLHEAPPTPLTHWTTRRVAKRLGVSHMTVARIWQRAGVQPHRLERYTESPDPDFERKAADIIGLYLNPPQHAVVFCVDEKTAIQALDRTAPVLPLSPGRAERHGFEYIRHGTLSLYAALNVHTGRVLGDTVPRHTAVAFVGFLDQVVAGQPKRTRIHIIADNLSAHKAKPVQVWLANHPQVTIHYTPTYSSWLNQVELWFAKIERDCIARGIFTSPRDLRKKLLQYIKLHNQTCQPMVWRYRDPTRRIRASRISVTAH